VSRWLRAVACDPSVPSVGGGSVERLGLLSGVEALRRDTAASNLHILGGRERERERERERDATPRYLRHPSLAGADESTVVYRLWPDTSASCLHIPSCCSLFILSGRCQLEQLRKHHPFPPFARHFLQPSPPGRCAPAPSSHNPRTPSPGHPHNRHLIGERLKPREELRAAAHPFFGSASPWVHRIP
jgi:hypothetical protein